MRRAAAMREAGRPGGQGLANMQARAAACGGRVEYARHGSGFGVVAELPV